SFPSIISIAQNFTFRMLTIKDGLAGSQVLSTGIDRRGYLWITTEGGLSRYDGSSFKNYNVGNGLPSNDVVYSFEDSAGQIWLTYKEGVCVFDGSHFTTYPIENPPKDIWITQLLLTSTHKMWFVTGKGMFELQNGIWKRHDLITMHQHTFLNQVIELNDHSLLFNCLDSLIIRSANGYCRTIAYSTNKSQPFQWITLIGGDYYVGTRNHLYLFRNNQLKLVHDDLLANKFIRTIFVDAQHRLWIGTLEHGIYVFSGDNYTQIDPVDVYPFSGHIYAIENFCQDYEGAIWAGTSGGLLKLSPSWVDFFNLRDEQRGVRSAFKDQYGMIYFGQVRNGFIFLKDNQLISSHAILDKSSSKMLNNWIQGFACDEKKRVWLTDNNQRLFRITGRHAEDMDKKLGLLSQYADHIIFNQLDSSIYMGGKHGLMRIKHDIVYEEFLFGEGEDRIVSLISDPGGNIWMCTQKGEIFEKLGNKVLQLNHQPPFNAITNIERIKFFGSNELWISTNTDGIYKFHRTDSGTFVKDFHITAADGLPNDNVHDFAIDKGGRVWVSTLGGLASMQFYTTAGKEHFAVTKYGEQDGFHDTFSLYSMLVTDDAGNIWLSTENYLAKILGDQLVNDTVPPVIHIENVRLFNSNTEWGKYASGFTPFFHLPINPILSHDQNDITIEYKAIGFKDPVNISFSYMLEGIDKDWNSNGSNTHITYGNLSPGNYVFKVRARKPVSPWSTSEGRFEFIINPPWWGTIWFRSILVLSLISISYSIYWNRLKQSLAKAKFEKQISDVEMKALRAQMNPHFIFNSLNSIHQFIQLNNTNVASAYLIKFSKLMRLILENSRHTLVPIEKDIQALRLYMELESARMDGKFTIDIIIGKGLDQESTMIPPLILQPFVENAIWHGIIHKDGPGKIAVSINKENDMISCVVQDDGIGRERARQLKPQKVPVKHESLGMKLTYERIQIINSIYQSKAYAMITDLYDENQNALGTRIEVKLPLELNF
ncbi:MAG TPA: two-component regulator propeller domain-containing protein, partial [Puia sp.]|nr:two-component regulator propeller domain-containing protein [Puia sp.]